MLASKPVSEMTARERLAGDVFASLVSDREFLVAVKKDPRYDGTNSDRIIAINARVLAETLCEELDNPTAPAPTKS